MVTRYMKVLCTWGSGQGSRLHLHKTCFLHSNVFPLLIQLLHLHLSYTKTYSFLLLNGILAIILILSFFFEVSVLCSCDTVKSGKLVFNPDILLRACLISDEGPTRPEKFWREIITYWEDSQVDVWPLGTSLCYQPASNRSPTHPPHIPECLLIIILWP